MEKDSWGRYRGRERCVGVCVCVMINVGVCKDRGMSVERQV